MKKSFSENKRASLFSFVAFFVLFVLVAFCIAHPAYATDLFAAGKETIKNTAGEDSAVETAMLASGAVGAAVLGFTTRNWLAAAGGFAGGMIFWEVIKPLVGLA
ncbi:type IV conjugative transfer system pilin TraA [Vibrio harveyi]|uniref:type IV conjugative transfer system pilin TraA n=1 Tax=Vibrio harveyi TaxID=669 RepID=UPI0025B2120B|nr:type IV conjugative transfer system pilin TraA [Vibrio harveyi]WJT10960.1 type IV conjugative transfer system pilin TraA [Vibrio harveyi]